MDRFALFAAFISGEMVKINEHTGIIQLIEREDGSGYRFNIVLSITPEVKRTTYVNLEL